MTKSSRLLFASLALGVPLLAGAAHARIAGGSGPRADCYSEFDGITATNPGRLPPRVECADGDACDTDGVCGNGFCVFQVRLCLNQKDPAVPICKPPANGLNSLQVLPNYVASDLVEGLDLKGSACGAFVGIPVGVRHFQNTSDRPGRTQLRVTARGLANPSTDKDRVMLVCNPRPSNRACPTPTTTTTTTTLPDPCRPNGGRVFSIGDASHVYAGLLGPDQPADLAGPGTRTGKLVLVKGTPDANGVASLSLSCDAIIGITVVDGSYACLKLEAAGSSGKIDCDGGTPVDVTVTGNSHEDTDGHNDSPTVQIEQGSPGPAGAAYLIANGRFVNCADDGSHDGLAGGCLAPFTNGTADCSDPTKVDFSKAKLALPGGVSTTGTATTTIANPKGTAPAIIKTGTPFNCSAFSTPGQGVFETPAMFYDFPLLSGDVTAMLQIGE